MDKREKLIQGLKCCDCEDLDACQRCPYIDDGCIESPDSFKTAIIHDAVCILTDTAKVKIYHDNGITSWCVCGRCSATVSKGDKFCHECGRQLQWNG